MTTTATLTLLDKPGMYRIEAEGFSLTSRYPVNRMAKVLFDHGHRGRLEVYGPSADGKRTTLRMHGDIEALAAKRLSESDNGFRQKAWDEVSQAALNGTTEVAGTTQDGRDSDLGTLTPSNDERPSTGKGFAA